MMNKERFQNYCTMCGDYKDYECEMYHRIGEDTYDFRLCHKHEKELWMFLGESAEFSWEDHENDGGDES